MKNEKLYKITDPAFGDDTEITFEAFVEGLEVAGYKFAEAKEALRHGCDVIVVDGKIVAYEISDYETVSTIYSE